MRRPLRDYRHIVWDWNGTLLDDFAVCLDSLNHLLALHGRPPITGDHYRSIFEFPVIKVYAALGFPTDHTSFAMGSIAFMAHYEGHRHACRLHPGARETLAHLRAAGITQSVLSAYKHDLLVSIIREYDLADFFTDLSGNDDIHAHGKAGRARAHREALGIAPGDILYIGDTEHDAETADAMGADCILLAHGHQPLAKLLATGHPVVRDFDELLSRA